MDGILDCITDRAERRFSYLEVVQQAFGRDGVREEAADQSQRQRIALLKEGKESIFISFEWDAAVELEL